MMGEPQRRVLGTIDPLLRLRYFAFDGERNYEDDFLRVLAVQLLDFSGFIFSFVLIPSLILQGHLIQSWIWFVED